MSHRMSAIAVLGTATAFALGVPTALAANSPNAGCVGAGSSALAPGQGDFAPGGRADVSQFLNSLSGPSGQYVKGSAQEKGTAEQCFPEGPPGGTP
jgi:hypothetical protein